ncbi:MAG: OmpA family protein [Phaeodactylibacter sp.]|nr:OmpA family protein [Phaeodactylibacter sp.]
MRRILPLLFLIVPLLASAQSIPGASTSNIVPNPGFERFSATPIGWFYKGEHFTRVMKYWSSPTGASPDVFGPKVRVPETWADKDFGKHPPHSGGAMAGVTLYGCKDGKPHCREYVQVQLVEPLVIGQQYYVEFWTSHLPRSIRINQIGACFTKEKIDIPTDERLDLVPQIYAEKIVEIRNNNWTKISGYFTATEESEFLILGNFAHDLNTLHQDPPGENLNYAYYYLDDILVKKIPPILPVPIKEDDLTRIDLEEGDVIKIKDLYFEFDEWELHPRSYVELRKLLSLMNANPDMVIQISGHTDSIGPDDYNRYLSRKRAKSVVLYLMENGISPARLLYKGYGSSQPVATNSTPEGRQLNRRVEFQILKK